MSGWVIALIVLGYVCAGAVVTLVILRYWGKVDSEMDINNDDCGYVAAVAVVWPIMLVGLLFALFGRCLIQISKKGGSK